MAVYRRPARSRITLLLLVLTSVTLITFDYRGTGSGVIEGAKHGAADLFAPVQDASNRVFAPVGNLVGGVAHYGSLKAENAHLRQELESQRGAVLRADDAERQTKALLDQSGLSFVGDIPTVRARVVSTSLSNVELTVQLDAGTQAGVAKGMPVVTGAGLVGRVTDASRKRCTVLLITDKTLSVGVRLASGDVGVATGQGAHQPLTVSDIDPASKVGTGEVAVTSGLQGSLYPPGVPVGKVASARAPGGRLEQDVTIKPAVDLGRLDFVTILQWSGS